MNRVALFDFCETLVNFQTADAFVDFVRTKSQNKRMFILERIRMFLIKFHVLAFLERRFFSRIPIHKITKLFQLRGLCQKELEYYASLYYNEKIKPNFIPKVLAILKDKQKNGYTIAIVSGGYGIYLKYFAKEFNVPFVLSSNIKFKNNVCTGLLDGPDCMEENKIKYLEKVFAKDRIQSEAYSDSITDLPLLNWADQGYVISKGKHQNWISDNLIEIIW